RLRLDGEREHLLVEDPAVAYADRLAGEVDGDVGRHRDVAPDADEVHVEQLPPGRVALDLAGEREDALSVDLQRDERVGATRAGEDVRQVAGGHRYRAGLRAQPVHDR